MGIAVNIPCYLQGTHVYMNLKGRPKHFRGSEYAYKQIVLPSIQCCSAIWDPYYQNAIAT